LFDDEFEESKQQVRGNLDYPNSPPNIGHRATIPEQRSKAGKRSSLIGRWQKNTLVLHHTQVLLNAFADCVIGDPALGRCWNKAHYDRNILSFQ